MVRGFEPLYSEYRQSESSDALSMLDALFTHACAGLGEQNARPRKRKGAQNDIDPAAHALLEATPASSEAHV